MAIQQFLQQGMEMPTPYYQTLPKSPSSGDNSGGVYWVGQDGNVWVKGSQGTNSAGAFDANSNNYWSSRGFTRIADPNGESNGASNSGGGYGYGGGNSSATQQNSFKNALGQNINSIVSGGNAGFDVNRLDLQNQANKIVDDAQKGQRQLNTARDNQALNYMNNVEDIRNYVRDSLTGANTQLAGMGATNSSAAGEMARVYSEIGQGKLAKAGNADALKQNELNSQQGELDIAKAAALRDLNNSKEKAILTIGQDVQNKLTELDNQGRNLGLDGQVQIEALKQQIVNEGSNKLKAVSDWLNSQLGGVKGQGAEVSQSNAQKLKMQGVDAGAGLGLGEGQGIQTGVGMGLNDLPIYLKPQKDDKR